MDRITISKIQDYMRSSLRSKHIKVEGRENKLDSADVTLNGEFIGVVFEDKEAYESHFPENYFRSLYTSYVVFR